VGRRVRLVGEFDGPPRLTLTPAQGGEQGPENQRPENQRLAKPDAYLEQEKQVAELTLGTNRGAVRARLIPFFGKDTPIGEITTERIDAYRANALTVGGAHGRPLKHTTVQRDLTNLSGILPRALKRGWIDTNPYADAEKIK
jgi:hypothetical protein